MKGKPNIDSHTVGFPCDKDPSKVHPALGNPDLAFAEEPPQERIDRPNLVAVHSGLGPSTHVSWASKPQTLNPKP